MVGIPKGAGRPDGSNCLLSSIISVLNVDEVFNLLFLMVKSPFIFL